VSNVGYATISIIPNLKGFQEKLTQETEGASISAGKSGGLSLGKTMLGTLGGLGIGVAVSKALDIGKSVLEFDSGIQQSTTALTTLLHSAPAANALVSQLQSLAQASSLLDTGNAVHLGQVLVGMGDPVQNVTKDMQALGDATAGVGGTQDTLNSLARAWGQMSAKGKIQSDEILQMTEQGVPALQLLAKAYGVPTSQMSNMIQKGQILSSDALPKLRDQIEKSFGGADAAAGANSIGGAFDRIKESALGLAGAAAMPLIKALTPIIANLADELSSPKIQAFVNSIGPKITGLFGGMGNASGLLSKIAPYFAQIVAAGEHLWTVLQPIVTQIFARLQKDILPNLVPMLQKGLKVIADGTTTIAVVVDKLWQIFGPSILGALDVIIKTLVNMFNAAYQVVEGVFEVIQGLFTGDWSKLWQGVKDIFGGAWNYVVAQFRGSWEMMGKILQAAWALIVELFGGAAKWFEDYVWHPIVEGVKLYIGLVVLQFKLAWDGIKAAWSGVTGFFSAIWDGLISGAKASVDGVVAFFTDLPGWILGALEALPGLALQGLKDFAYSVGFGIGLAVKAVLEFPGQVLDIMTSLWHDAVSIGTSLWSDVTSGFASMVSAVVGEVEALPGQVGGFFVSMWQSASQTASNLAHDVAGFFSRMVGDAVHYASGLLPQIGGIFLQVWNDAESTFSNGIGIVLRDLMALPGDAIGVLNGLGAAVESVCSDAIHWLEQAGKDVIDGLINGIESAWHKVTDLAGQLGDAVSKGFKDALGINSPSKVFKAFGEGTVEGYVMGITGTQHQAINSVRSMASGVVNAFNGTGPVGVGAALANAVGGGSRTLNYYATGSGLSSEDELFAAAGRTRMVW
jgi:tape measure domain-containing protein